MLSKTHGSLENSHLDEVRLLVLFSARCREDPAASTSEVEASSPVSRATPPSRTSRRPERSSPQDPGRGRAPSGGRRLPAGLSEPEAPPGGPERASGRSPRRPGQRPGTRVRAAGRSKPVSEPLTTAAAAWGVPRAPPPNFSQAAAGGLAGRAHWGWWLLAGSSPSLATRALATRQRGDALRVRAQDSTGGASNPGARVEGGASLARACDVSAPKPARSGGGREGQAGAGSLGAGGGERRKGRPERPSLKGARPGGSQNLLKLVWSKACDKFVPHIPHRKRDFFF